MSNFVPQIHGCLRLVTLILLCAVSLLATSPRVRAQTAPAGNAHPATQAISESTANLPNPFGAPIEHATTAAEAKIALYKSLNLDPLRSLAVQHDGRVKILDTLARETIQRVAGRRNYQDLVAAEGGREKKVGYDPLFTLLDLLIDPAYYVDKPLVFVEFLPLRQEILKNGFPGDDAMQERWLKLMRVSPRMIVMQNDALREKFDFQPSYRQALDQASMALEIFNLSASNLLLVAPTSSDAEYQHLSTLPETHPARVAAQKLGAAWRAGDAAAANAAIATLAAEIPKINAQYYPTTRRSIEYAYNRAHAFEWGLWMYAVSFLTLILAFGTGRKPLIALGLGTLALAIGLHGFGFITRCIVAERFAIQNQFESMTGISLFAACVGLAITVLKRQWLFGAAAAGVGFLVLITATQTSIPGKFIEREAAILNTSVLLKYHVTTVLCGYGLISLGFIVSLFYLGTYYANRLRSSPAATSTEMFPSPQVGTAPLAATALNLPEGAPVGPARTLSDLDKAQMTILQLAFWVLGTGILLGAWWADHSWGRWWAFDPKETWALATWIIYLIVIHLRFATGPKRALVTAWLSVLGFVVMLWTYFGVNLLLPGLHAYA
jgi:cytochrome c-type biogenesis protein CcsB